MKNKKPAEMSNDELIKNEKKLKALTLVFAGILIVSFVTILILRMRKDFSPVIATPIALFPLLIVLINNWNELKKEIKSRNL